MYLRNPISFGTMRLVIRHRSITMFLFWIPMIMNLMIVRVIAEENKVLRKYSVEELVELALEKNPSISSATSRIDIANGELRAAKAYPNPEAEFFLARGKSREGSNSEAEFGIAVVQPIEWPLKRIYRRRAAEEETKVTEFDKEAVKLELVFATKRFYYSILLAKKNAEIAKQNLETSKTLLAIIERRVELGESRELDFIKSRVETLNFERELIRAETNLGAVKAILNKFLGDSLEKDFDLEDELTYPSTIYALENFAQRVADFNPQIKAQETEVKRAGFSLLEQKHQRVPDILLQGFYEKEIDRIGLGGGIGITIPLWYLNQGGIQTARAEERRASLDLKLLEIEITSRLEDEYKNYKVAFEQSKIFSGELLDRAKRSLEIAQFSYEQGEIGLLDVLDALRTYRDTLKEYYQVLYEFYLSQITLERIAGGKI
jgi:cobalt-zinc-cadmium efflux system outer membrane protein